MATTYEKVGWINESSGETPVSAENLDHMDSAIKDLYDEGATSKDIVIGGTEPPEDEDAKIWFPDNVVNSRANEIDLYYPVGTYYETSNVNFNPNIEWGGTWEKEEDGTVLSSKSTVTGSLLNAEVGSIVGEDSHTLTVNEIPEHNHAPLIQNQGSRSSGISVVSPEANAGYYSAGELIGNAGENQPHNNIQRTKICIRWHRIA